MEKLSNFTNRFRNMANINDLETFAKNEKSKWVKLSKRGDLHPTIIIEKNEEIVSICVAPQVDRDLGLFAAQTLRVSMEADAITVIFDAHMAKSEPGETEEDIRKKYPPGSMQKMCDNENACDLGIITDVILCYRVTVDDKMSMLMIPYSYHGQGTIFKWMPTEKDLKSASGLIPDTLRQIMHSKTFLDGEDGKKLAKDFGFNKGRAVFHTSRVGMQLLESDGFVVFDGITSKHPEWID